LHEAAQIEGIREFIEKRKFAWRWISSGEAHVRHQYN
jgi:hypothetical protein